MTAALAVRPELGTLADEPPAGAALTLARPSGLLRPIASPAEIITSQEEVRELVKKTLKEGRDYGTIPNVDKPSLLKPGAERICAGFGVFARFKILEQQIEHDREVPWVKRKKKFEGRGESRKFLGWEEERGVSFGLYRYVIECELIQRDTGMVVGSCPGTCSTMESKYVDRPRDSENTVLKMAGKRAHVGATLLTFGLSEQFTQDVEDLPRDAIAGAAPSEEGAEDSGRTPAPPCPTCQGPMYDNRDTNLERVAAGKKRMPDFKCKNKDCKDAKGETTVVWHLKESPKPATELAPVAPADPPTPAPSTAPSRGTLLDRALEFPLPGTERAWGGFGGKPLKECGIHLLYGVADWTRKKVDAEPNAQLEELLGYVQRVIDARENGEVEEPGGAAAAEEGGAA